MSSFEEKAVCMQTNYIQKKLKGVQEETDRIIDLIKRRFHFFELRFEELIQKEGDDFVALYRNLNGDIEDFQQKLILIRARVEVQSESNLQEASLNAEKSSSPHFANIFPHTANAVSTLSSSSSDTFELNTNLQSSSSTSSNAPQSDYTTALSNSYASICDNVLTPSACPHTSKRQNLDYRSPASCSLPSNLSDSECLKSLETSTSHQEINYSESTVPKQIKRTILPLKHVLPVSKAAMLAHIENPGNFWMKLESSKAALPSFPRQEFDNSPIPSNVEEGDFYLALSTSVPYYFRVKVLSKVQKNMDIVDVFYIDHGSSQTIPIKELRVLPDEAYAIPMQAFHCFLSEITARNNIWCYAAIYKLKQFSNNCIEAHIKCKVGEKYGVQLISTTIFDEEYSCDIGQLLCMEGFAIEIKVKEEEFVSSRSLCDASCEMSNQLSCDSGVSVTFNQQSSPSHQCESSEDIQALEPVDGREQSECVESDQSPDLISFVSLDEVNSLADPRECKRTCMCECFLHFIIPFPSVKFFQNNNVLVMLSHIVDPSEFYVNNAMEESGSLDELMEQMTDTYGSHDDYAIVLDHLKEGMFCAANYKDGNWYRVKVLDIHLNFDDSPNVYVQYVDYGNRSWIRYTDLRTLKPEFAKDPAYAIKCSLAGVLPVGACPENSFTWSEEAINVFKNMVNFEHCLTAQICGKTAILNEDPLQILLWDNRGEQDELINSALQDKGVAELDLNIVKELLNIEVKTSSEQEILNKWDPMTDEYNAIQNSYGVNIEDCEVAISGYKHNDEEYSCKYFALRGYCPRGRNCTFEHVPLAEGGVTRDKEELYSFNNPPPLPKPGSNVLVQVCSVITPSHFYVQLPFQNLTVDEIDSHINKGLSKESLQNKEVYALYKALNTHYSNKPFDERTTVALSSGTIVVAQHNKNWHRARVIEVCDVDGPSKVFFVDFGNTEWVERRNIREILPEYLHTPFQAIESCLSDVEPLGIEKNMKWSTQAISCFKSLVQESVMLAHVTYRCNDILQMSLRRTTQEDHRTVSDHLVREGFGQPKNPGSLQTTVTLYVPG